MDNKNTLTWIGITLVIGIVALVVATVGFDTGQTAHTKPYDDSFLNGEISTLNDVNDVQDGVMRGLRLDLGRIKPIDLESESKIRISKLEDDVDDLDDDIDDLEDDFDDFDDDFVDDADLNPLKNDISTNAASITTNTVSISNMDTCAENWNSTSDDLEDFINCLNS